MTNGQKKWTVYYGTETRGSQKTSAIGKKMGFLVVGMKEYKDHFKDGKLDGPSTHYYPNKRKGMESITTRIYIKPSISELF